MTKIMREQGSIEQISPAPAAISVPVYGDPESVSWGEIKPGDYVLDVPAQQRYRAATVNSGVTAAEITHDWYVQTRKRGPKFPLRGARLTFISGDKLNLPCDFHVNVRRPLPGNETRIVHTVSGEQRIVIITDDDPEGTE
jgi:hypothetical protein